jgi:hypothetical protein
VPNRRLYKIFNFVKQLGAGIPRLFADPKDLAEAAAKISTIHRRS